MEKKLRLKFTAAFAQRMTVALPEFTPTEVKSAYVWPGESLWRRNDAECSCFIVLSPEPKGQRDEMNVELAWSRFKRFPELTQRPSLVTHNMISDAASKSEGSVRIGRLCGEEFDWIPVRAETISDVAEFLVTKLSQHGVPFLDRICR
jgi:hypothetical protein